MTVVVPARELLEVETLASQWETEIRERRTRVQKIIEKTDELKSALSVAQRRSAFLTSVVDARKLDLDKRIAEQEAELKQLESTWAARKATLQKQIDELKVRKGARQSTDQMKRLIETLTQEELKFNQTAGQLRATIADAQGKRAALETQLEQSVTEVTDVERRLQALQQEKKELAGDIEDLRRQLVTKQQEVDAKVREKEIAQREEAGAKERERALQERLEALTQELKERKQSDQLASIMQEKKELEASKTAADASVKQLEEQVSAFEDEKGKLEGLTGRVQNTIEVLHGLQEQEKGINEAQMLVLQLSEQALFKEDAEVIARLQPYIQSESVRDKVKELLDHVERDLTDPSAKHLEDARRQLESDVAKVLPETDAALVKEQVTKLLATYGEAEKKGLTESEWDQLRMRFLKRATLHHLLTLRLRVQLQRVEALQQQLELVNATAESKQVLADVHTHLEEQLQQHLANAQELREDAQVTSVLLERLKNAQTHGLYQGNVQLQHQLQQQLRDAQQQKNQAIEALSAKEEELREAQSNAVRVTELEAELARVNAELATTRTSCGTNIDLLKAERAARAQVEASLTRQQSETTRLQDLLTASQAQVAAVQVQLSGANARKQEAESKVQEVESQLAETSRALEAQARQNQQHELHLRAAEAQYGRLQQESTAYVRNLEFANAEKSTSLKQQIKALQDNNIAVTTQLNAATIRVQELQTEMESKNEQYRQALQAENASHNEQLRVAAAQVSSLQAQNASNMEQLGLALLEVNKLKAALAHNNEELRQTAEAQARAEAEANAELGQARGALTKAQAQNEAISAQLQEAQARVEHWKKEIATGLQSQQQLQEQVTALTAQLQKLTEERQEMTERMKTLEGELRIVYEREEELKIENNALQAEVRRVSKAHERDNAEAAAALVKTQEAAKEQQDELRAKFRAQRNKIEEKLAAAKIAAATEVSARVAAENAVRDSNARAVTAEKDMIAAQEHANVLGNANAQIMGALAAAKEEARVAAERAVAVAAALAKAQEELAAAKEEARLASEQLASQATCGQNAASEAAKQVTELSGRVAELTSQLASVTEEKNKMEKILEDSMESNEEALKIKDKNCADRTMFLEQNLKQQRDLVNNYKKQLLQLREQLLRKETSRLKPDSRKRFRAENGDTESEVSGVNESEESEEMSEVVEGGERRGMGAGARSQMLDKYMHLADAFHAVNKTKWQGKALYDQGLRGGVDTRTSNKHMNGLKQQHDKAQVQFQKAQRDFIKTIDSLLPLA